MEDAQEPEALKEPGGVEGVEEECGALLGGGGMAADEAGKNTIMARGARADLSRSAMSVCVYL